ncbi:hypothetical protein [Streptomyces sp. NPDC057293]|uniref:hypothetical protein n=1 Tax=unclassified Streptomyces TaxID=2593676 RepID=UPI003644088A
MSRSTQMVTAEDVPDEDPVQDGQRGRRRLQRHQETVVAEDRGERDQQQPPDIQRGHVRRAEVARASSISQKRSAGNPP